MLGPDDRASIIKQLESEGRYYSLDASVIEDNVDQAIYEILTWPEPPHSPMGAVIQRARLRCVDSLRRQERERKLFRHLSEMKTPVDGASLEQLKGHYDKGYRDRQANGLSRSVRSFSRQCEQTAKGIKIKEITERILIGNEESSTIVSAMKLGRGAQELSELKKQLVARIQEIVRADPDNAVLAYLLLPEDSGSGKPSSRKQEANSAGQQMADDRERQQGNTDDEPAMPLDCSPQSIEEVASWILKNTRCLCPSYRRLRLYADQNKVGDCPDVAYHLTWCRFCTADLR